MPEIPESHRYLLDAQVATLATIEPDGTPQLSEVWFLSDDGEVRLSLNSARRKSRNLSERPECSLLILDLENPYKYLELRGRARIEPDEDHSVAEEVHAKYGADVTQYDQPGDRRLAVTIEPTRIRAVDMS
jgi:PPOX class probable F420-dependent enzyme